MNKLLALCYFVLSLYGCDVGHGTFVDRDRSDGADTLHGRAVVEGGVARFECLVSVSGRCYYIVFPRDCASPPAPAPTGKRTASCVARPIKRCALAEGDGRECGLPRSARTAQATDSDIKPQ